MAFFGGFFGSRKKERGRHPANAFVLYFQDQYKQRGGNIYQLAKECGQKWKNLPIDQKLHYKRIYIQNRYHYGMKMYGGYKKPSQADKWRRWPKVQRTTERLSKKKQAELAAKAAAEAAAKLKVDSSCQCDDNPYVNPNGSSTGTPATGQGSSALPQTS